MVISSRSSARRNSDSSVRRSLLRARIDGLNTSMRSPPMRLAWYIASSASLSTSSVRLGCPSPSEIDDDHGQPDGGVGLGEGQHAFEPVDEQLAIGQSGQIVVDRVVQQALF